MNFIQKLRDTVEVLGLPFMYGTAEELNELTQNNEMPAAMCYILIDSQMVRVGGQMCEQASVTIFFIDKTSFYFGSEENEGIINECQNRANRWIDSIRKGNHFSITGTINYRRIYLEFMTPYTGIGVNLLLRENLGAIFCPDEVNYYLADGNNNYIVTGTDELIELSWQQ